MSDSRITNLSKILGERGRKAHEKHKNDDINWGIVDLPAGIKNGIAQLKLAKIDTYKKGLKVGKPYAMFSSRVMKPLSHAGVRTLGQNANVMITLADEPNRRHMETGEPITFEDNYAKLIQLLLLLGVNVSEIDELDMVPPVLESLQESAPYITFSTKGWTKKPTKENPNPTEMVFVHYEGLADWSPNQQDGEQKFRVNDSTKVKDDEENPVFDDGATGASVQADTGSVVVDAQDDQEGDVEAPELDATGFPSVGDSAAFTPTDAKGRKGKTIECEILSVNDANKTCIVKSFDGAKRYVATFDQLSQISVGD